MPQALTQAPLHLMMTTDAVGGVWTYSLDLAEALQKTGIRVTLAVMGPSPDGAKLAEAAALGIDLVETGAALDWLAFDEDEVEAAAQALRRLARDMYVDVLQLHSPTYLAFQPLPIPAIVVMHSCVATWWAAVRGGALPEDLAWREALAARGLQHADIVVAPSGSFADDVADRYACHRPVVVSNARRKPPLLTSSYMPGVPEGLFALTAGRLWDEAKSVRTLDVATEHAGIPVLAAGSLCSPRGDCIQLTAIVALGGLSTRQMRTVYNARPIFVSCSVYEPFGLSVLEAAQAACPLVLADIPTFRELWHDAALFVPARDPQALAEALSELAADDALRLGAAKAAYTRAQEFTPQRQARRMSALYRCARADRTREAAE